MRKQNATYRLLAIYAAMMKVFDAKNQSQKSFGHLNIDNIFENLE